jgi:hypothetical protein
LLAWDWWSYCASGRFHVSLGHIPCEWVRVATPSACGPCQSTWRLHSFWHVVGRPSVARGFLPGRSLLAGELRPDYGGGLCQLSGLIYYASLMAGLTIVERHPHSRDIYDEQMRYAPLGADATVAYGFKDLRVLSSLSFPSMDGCVCRMVLCSYLSPAQRSVQGAAEKPNSYHPMPEHSINGKKKSACYLRLAHCTAKDEA